jgi:hypothetical protein
VLFDLSGLGTPAGETTGPSLTKTALMSELLLRLTQRSLPLGPETALREASWKYQRAESLTWCLFNDHSLPREDVRSLAS